MTVITGGLLIRLSISSGSIISTVFSAASCISSCKTGTPNSSATVSIVAKSSDWVTVAVIPLKKRDLIISELSRLNLSANSWTVKLSSGTIIISGLTCLASLAAFNSSALLFCLCLVVSFFFFLNCLIDFWDLVSSDFSFLGRARLADKIEIFSPEYPLVSDVNESSFSPIIWTFCLCFWGFLLLNASSFALSSQSVLPGFFELFENALWGGFLELGVAFGRLLGAFAFCLGASIFCFALFFLPRLSFSELLFFWSCKSSLGDTGFLIPEEFWLLNLEPGLLGMPGLLGESGLLGLPCLLNEPGLPWSEGLFLKPGLLGMPGLLGEPGLFETVCLKAMFCLLLFCLSGFIFGSSLLIGAPTSSGVFILLLKIFVVGLFVFWSGLFDSRLLSPALEIFWEDSLDLTLLLIFLGFAISWIGGFAGFLIGGVVLFAKVFLSWFKFCEGLLFVFLFVRFARDCELLVFVGLLRIVGLFEIIFWLSGLLRGLINNGFFFEFSSRGFPFIEAITEDSFSLFCL